MGGYGSGATPAVVGAGRKPKDENEKWLSGTGGKPGRTKAQPFELVEAPADLADEQRAIWDELAPFAAAERTLTRGQVRAFRDLCEAIVMRGKILAKIETDGLTFIKVSVDGAGVEHHEIKSHPLLPQYRGMMQRVEAGMARFKLSPLGKPVEAQPEPDADPMAEFDGPDQLDPQ